jgi:hypothetical protein
MSRLAVVCEAVSAAVLCAASFAALVTNAEGPHKRTIEATLDQPPRVLQPVRQHGTVVAVSGDSVTARSANGYTQTYLVTPNTTVISRGAGQPVSAASHFTINDQIDIVGTIQDGTALATAVADGGLGRGDGPPMDYLGAQPISATDAPAG